MKKLVDKIKTIMNAAYQTQKLFYDHKNQPQTFKMGNIVLLFIKNLGLPGIWKVQFWFVPPFK